MVAVIRFTAKFLIIQLNRMRTIYAIRSRLIIAAVVMLVKIKTTEEVMTLETIHTEINRLIADHPGVISSKEIGKSYENRSIFAVKMFSGSRGNAKKILLEFGAHGREWATPASALHFIQTSLNDKNNSAYVHSIEWHVIPLLNPDGYHYTITKDKMWRKNRRPIPGSSCIGVDLNRNFPSAWGEPGVNDPCSYVYLGPSPLSEEETIGLNKFAKDLGQIDAYVSVHSCGQGVFHPYGYSKRKQPPNLTALVKVAVLMKEAMEKVRGNPFVVGPAADMGEAGGATDDWAYQHLHIPLTYTLELGYHGYGSTPCFHPKPAQMRDLVRECCAAIQALAVNIEPQLSNNTFRCFGTLNSVVPRMTNAIAIHLLVFFLTRVIIL